MATIIKDTQRRTEDEQKKMMAELTRRMVIIEVKPENKHSFKFKFKFCDRKEEENF